MTEPNEGSQAQAQVIETRGRKLPPAPPVSQSTSGKPPGAQSVEQNEN